MPIKMPLCDKESWTSEITENALASTLARFKPSFMQKFRENLLETTQNLKKWPALIKLAQFMLLYQRNGHDAHFRTRAETIL